MWAAHCFHCDRKLTVAHHGFCCQCRKLISSPPYCGQCGAALEKPAIGCEKCLQFEPKWQRLVCAGRYHAPLSHWIHRFKYRNQPELDRALARLLLFAVKTAQANSGLILPEALLPVPLHWRRQWRRGFNQAERLAHWLGKWLQIPVLAHAFERTSATAQQQKLDAQARRENVRNRFCYRAEQIYQCVAIIDDVLTTGATAEALALPCLRAGVQEVQVWVLAKTD